MHPDIAKLHAETAANLAHAELFSTLTPAQFNWRALPGTWSIAECIAHLNLVDGKDLPRVQAIVKDARERNQTHPGPYKYSWIVRWASQSQEPPVKRKYKAPKFYQPPPDADPQATLDEYRRIMRAFLEVIAQSDGLDLARVRVSFVNMGWLKMPLGARFALLTSHDRRHLWQADQVRANPSFPQQ